MNSIPLITNRVGADATVDASAKITAKKNNTATAMAPNTAISFTKFGVTAQDLNLTLASKEYLVFQNKCGFGTCLITKKPVSKLSLEEAYYMRKRTTSKEFLKGYNEIYQKGPTLKYNNPDGWSRKPTSNS